MIVTSPQITSRHKYGGDAGETSIMNNSIQKSISMRNSKLQFYNPANSTFNRSDRNYTTRNSNGTVFFFNDVNNFQESY